MDGEGVSKLNVLVVGTGMYVCGRGTEGFGTILPALYESKRNGRLGEIYIAGTRAEGLETLRQKVCQLNELTGVRISPELFPRNTPQNARAYKEAIRALPRPACAIVVAPDNLHREIAGATIQAGLHTLVAKPLAPTKKEALELVELQQKSGVYCAVEFHKRLDRSNLRLKDAIEQGLVGDPLYFVVEYSQRKSVPSKHFREWAATTNVFQYLGVHYVDIIYFATGANPKRVAGIGQKGWLAKNGIDTYDSIQAMIDWESPSGTLFSSLLSTSWVDPEATSAMSDQKIKVVGTKGRYEADQKERGIRVITDQRGIEELNPDFCMPYGPAKEVVFRGYGIESVLQFLTDAELVEAGRVQVGDLESKRPTFRDSIVSTAVIDGVSRSLAQQSAWADIAI